MILKLTFNALKLNKFKKFKNLKFKIKKKIIKKFTKIKNLI